MNKLNLSLTITLMMSLLFSLLGCAPNYLIYVYDTQTGKITGVEHQERNKPGLLVGNCEEISYCNSNDDFFITTQIMDRQNSGFIVKKRNYKGKIIDEKDVFLGKAADYSRRGGFCVNGNMSKGAVFSYPKGKEFNERLGEFIPCGEIDLMYYDFNSNTSKVILSTDGDSGKEQLTWIDNNRILFISRLFEENQEISIIDTSNPDNITIKKIFESLVDFRLSDDHKKIYYNSYESREWGSIHYYDINAQQYREQDIPGIHEISVEIEARFEYENNIVFLTKNEVAFFDIDNLSWSRITLRDFNDLYFEKGISTKSGVLLLYTQKKIDEQNHVVSQETCFFVPQKKAEQIRLIDVKDIYKWYIGYQGRYVVLQK